MTDGLAQQVVEENAQEAAEWDAAARPLAGRILAAGPRACVLSVPLPASLPIPLGVAAPSGIDLAAWAFVGLAAADPLGPRCLLVLTVREAAAGTLAGILAGRETFDLATHFRILRAALVDTTVQEGTEDERAQASRAILSAVSPATVDALADLAGLIRDEPVGSEAPHLALDADARAGTLSGRTIPNYLLLRRSGAWACARVAEATLLFGAEPALRLALEPAWGPREGKPSAVLCLHGGGYMPARIGTAR